MAHLWDYTVLLLFSVLQSITCDVEKIKDIVTDAPVVGTSAGLIVGSTMESRLGKPFFAFRGVPYAKPPIGILRFKAPEPVEPWKGVLNATKDGPRCPQPTAPKDVMDVDENCLLLNVYASELPTVKKILRKPVMFYIHSGEFYSVSGQSKNFAGPQFLMDRNIVLVTINYRLGSLGFLSTNSPDAPGNAGLKDQVMALKWIKNNIVKFGGDPTQVTLLGHSAGALSAGLHMVSPMSKGLFHRVIIMSASPTSQVKMPVHQLDLAKRQAKLVNCPESPTHYMIDCLRNVPAQIISNTLIDMFDFNWNPILLWTPVVEPDFGQERFLTRDPTELIQAGKFMKIPVIAGITADEFAEPAVHILNNSTLTEQMNLEWNHLAPICFLYSNHPEKSDYVSQVLKNRYIGEDLKGIQSLPGLHHLFSDSVIGFAVDRFVRLISKYTKTFYYKFSYKGRYSHFYYPDKTPFGVVHQDDLFYLFAVPQIAPMFTQKDPEHLTVERMTRMWTQFAQYGDPNNPLDPFLKDLRWRPTGIFPGKTIYLEINETMSMKENLYSERYEIWNQLFPLKQLTLQDMIQINLPVLQASQPIIPFSIGFKKEPKKKRNEIIYEKSMQTTATQ